MNNKEKRKYLSDLLLFLSSPFLDEINNRRDFLKLTPTILYKYRKFDKYAFDMIENDYAYLAPIKGLDDPFDCLTDFNTKRFYDEKNHKITEEGVNYITKLVCPKGIQNLNRKEVTKLALECAKEDGLDYNAIPKVIESNGFGTITKIEPFFTVMESFNENFNNVLKATDLDGFAKNAFNPGKRVGVCSLSEKRDNKVMWSLYGNNYKGYCIEYEIPKEKRIIENLCPVIYTRKKNNDFIEKMIEYSMAAFLRAVSNGHLSGNIGAAMELFCTKDTDWSYQSEWRIIAKAKERIKHLPIKAIYLGFKVSEKNEKKIIELSKRYGFLAFKMNKPNGDKIITYTRIGK